MNCHLRWPGAGALGPEVCGASFSLSFAAASPLPSPLPGRPGVRDRGPEPVAALAGDSESDLHALSSGKIWVRLLLEETGRFRGLLNVVGQGRWRAKDTPVASIGFGVQTQRVEWLRETVGPLSPGPWSCKDQPQRLLGLACSLCLEPPSSKGKGGSGPHPKTPTAADFRFGGGWALPRASRYLSQSWPLSLPGQNRQEFHSTTASLGMLAPAPWHASAWKRPSFLKKPLRSYPALCLSLPWVSSPRPQLFGAGTHSPAQRQASPA